MTALYVPLCAAHLLMFLGFPLDTRWGLVACDVNGAWLVAQDFIAERRTEFVMAYESLIPHQSHILGGWIRLPDQRTSSRKVHPISTIGGALAT